MKLLAVDDDPGVLRYLSEVLLLESFEVDVAESGLEGVRLAVTNRFDVIILDGVLPDIDGVDVVRRLRRGGCITPILMLTGVADPDYLVSAFTAGADDFLTKPCRSRELVVRVRSLARRVEPKLSTDRCRIDALESILWVDGEAVRLTKIEARIVSELMRAQGDFVSHQRLLDVVWGIRFDTNTNLVYTHLGNIRTKLARHGLRDLIESERGAGYRLTA